MLLEIRRRLKFLVDVGLDYLTLGRLAATLSGGEAQRIQLATNLGSLLVGTLYVLDEPSIGLHPRDNARLIKILENLRDIGNTVLVVEHDEETMRAADHILDIGLHAGELGGNLVFEGDFDELLKDETSLTAQISSRRCRDQDPAKAAAGAKDKIEIIGAREHNLQKCFGRYSARYAGLRHGRFGFGQIDARSRRSLRRDKEKTRRMESPRRVFQRDQRAPN